jgi:hypothetical protein
MARLQSLERRLSRLKQGLESKGIRVKAESLAWSQVQAILARGNLKVSEVLAGMEAVTLSQWRRATLETHLDTDFFAHEQWDASRELPWAPVDSGSRTEHLRRELERALARARS